MKNSECLAPLKSDQHRNAVERIASPLVTASREASSFDSGREKTCRAASALPADSLILDKKVVSSDADASTEKQILHRLMVDKIERGLRRTKRTAKCWLHIENFFKCGQTMDCVQWCTSCDEEHEMIQRCSKKYCPLCHWRITLARQEMIKKYAETIRNPQHVVLTQRNFLNISREKMREHYRNLTRIREQSVWKNVLGGCTSIEMTNKGEGWHLHSHSLIDCNFIPVDELARAWGKLVGQEFAIVHRKNIDSGAYEKEICKYVCKPAELVRWKTKDILNFIEAIHGTRFFFKFGSLLKASAEIKRSINRDKRTLDTVCPTCKAEDSFEFMPSKGMSTERKIKFIGRRI